MKKNLKTLTLEDVLKKFNLDKEGGNIQDIVDKIVGEKRRICIELNNQYHTAEEIRAIMSQLINKKVDDSFRLFPPFYTDFGIGIVLGRNVFINSGCHFQDWGGSGNWGWNSDWAKCSLCDM